MSINANDSECEPQMTHKRELCTREERTHLYGSDNVGVGELLGGIGDVENRQLGLIVVKYL